MKLLTALLLLLSTPLLLAQGSTDDKFDDNPDHRRFWQAALPGGEYVVALDRISSISKHQYILDGTLLVTEVTIDTNGNSLTRIYHITPVGDDSTVGTTTKIIERGNELLDQAGQRTGTNLQDMVHKKYPLTTHSKSIEYRVSELATLDALFSSIDKSWKSGKGRKFTVNE